jgi:predicted ArsR family transcriptional regulator
MNTSLEAAPLPSEASRLRLLVQSALRTHGAMTADECAAHLDLSPLSVRPRFTELKKLGLACETGARRRNQSGKFANVHSLI